MLLWLYLLLWSLLRLMLMLKPLNPLNSLHSHLLRGLGLQRRGGVRMLDGIGWGGLRDSCILWVLRLLRLLLRNNLPMWCGLVKRMRLLVSSVSGMTSIVVRGSTVRGRHGRVFSGGLSVLHLVDLRLLRLLLMMLEVACCCCCSCCCCLHRGINVGDGSLRVRSCIGRGYR